MSKRNLIEGGGGGGSSERKCGAASVGEYNRVIKYYQVG